MVVFANEVHIKFFAWNKTQARSVGTRTPAVFEHRRLYVLWRSYFLRKVGSINQILDEIEGWLACVCALSFDNYEEFRVKCSCGQALEMGLWCEKKYLIWLWTSERWEVGGAVMRAWGILFTMSRVDSHARSIPSLLKVWGLDYCFHT